MLPLEEAQSRLLDQITPLPRESVALDQSQGRVLAGDLTAILDLPSFDNSAMDGYAVQAKDLGQASPEQPVSLKLVDQIAAGQVSARELTAGECMRIFTGSAIPQGANAVIMQEDTEIDPATDGNILMKDMVKPWENLRLKGEDIKQGSPLLNQGDRLNAARLALLGAMGLGEAQVVQQPQVGILATGSELLEPGEPIESGKIFESNRLMLATLTRQAGGEARIYPLVADTLAETQQAMETALEECDAVVTSGGVSVGDLDFVKPAFEKAGGKLEFWRVSMRPGKPFVFGQRNGVHWFGLPGNPVSAMVTFLMMVRPALLKMQGAKQLFLPSFPARLGEAVSNPGNRRHFMRIALDKDHRVISTGAQASHMMSSLAAAEGLVEVPPETEWAAGREVEVLHW